MSLQPGKAVAVEGQNRGCREDFFRGPTGIFPGYRVTGDEASSPANWPVWLTDTGNPTNSAQAAFGDNYFQYIVFPNSGWTPTTNGAAENAHAADVGTFLAREAVVILADGAQ
jgi:hypothetical protein